MGRRGRPDRRRGPRWLKFLRAGPAIFWPTHGDRVPLHVRLGVTALAFGGPLAIAVAMLPLSLSHFAASWSAARGHGLPGTLLVSTVECAPRGGCQPVGRFTSDDENIAFDEARLAITSSLSPNEVGDAVPVTWQGQKNPVIVYAAEGTRTEWIFDLALIVFAMSAALWCALCVVDAVMRAIERPT